MPTEAAVVDVLRGVDDPELHRSIVELGMVRGVAIDGGRVAVTVALTVAGCPLRAEITKRVTDAVMPLEGVNAVDVDLTVMSDTERQELAQRLRAEQGGGHDHAHDHGHAHGQAPQARPNPFTDSRTRILAISSGKGGVGKSSVTTNLAV